MADTSEALPRGERSGSASKRKRVAIACVTCRARKARCDGRQPCSSCNSMGFQCVYSQSESSSNVIIGREYMSDLESRIQSLEHAFGGMQAAPAFSQAGSSPGMSGLLATARTDVAEHSAFERGLLLISGPKQIYFGPSSTVDLSRKVFSLIENMSAIYPLGLAGVMNAELSTARFTPESERPSGTTTPSNMLSIAFNDGARELVLRYFDNFGSVVPIIHRSSFLERFELARSGDSVINDRSWLALVNIVLALSIVGVAASALGSQEQTQQASVHQAISQQLLRESSLDDLNLSIVQCRYLTSQFFQIQRNLVRTLEECNIALEGAIHLGLHSSENTSVVTPAVEESRTKTWLAIVQYHRALCVAFGRPILISKDLGGATLQRAARGPVAPEIANSGVDSLSTMFFDASSMLSDISCTIIEVLYGNNASRLVDPGSSTLLHGMLSIDKNMADWVRQLPAGLTLMTSQELILFLRTAQEVGSMQRFRTLLSLRFRSMRLLQYRPLCVHRGQDASGSVTTLEQSMLQHLQNDILERAFESASEVIEMVYALSIAPQGGNWLSVEGAICSHYVFNAALTVLLVLLAEVNPAKGLTRKIDARAAENSIDHAIAALEWLNQERASSPLQTGFLRNALAAITSMNPSREVALYPISSEGSSVPSSNQPYFQPGNFAVYEEQTNIYRDMDLEGFLSSQ